MSVLARQLSIYASGAAREAAMFLFRIAGHPILRIDTWPRRIDTKTLPPIHQGIDFRIKTAQHAFIDGWSHPESSGRWSDGSEARNRLATAPNRVRHVFCEVDAHVFSPEGMRPPRIQIWANDYFVEIWPAEPLALRRRFEIPRAAVFGRRSLVLTFVVRDAKSPAELGLSRDARKLGIHIRRIQVMSSQL